MDAKRYLCLVSALASLLGCMAFASAASAALWKFEGEELKGVETVVGSTASFSMGPSFFTVTCESTLQMKIWNSGGQAKGEVTGLTFVNCSTNYPPCTVEAIKAELLPWPARGVTISTKNYLVLEGIRVSSLYDDEECPLDETLIFAKGSAGALFDNGTGTATFNPASLAATGTKMTMLSTTADWIGAFQLKATGPHAGQTLNL